MHRCTWWRQGQLCRVQTPALQSQLHLRASINCNQHINTYPGGGDLVSTCSSSP